MTKLTTTASLNRDLQPTSKSRKAYAAPKIQRYGDFRDHTLGSSPGSSGIGLQIIQESPLSGISIPNP
jgi:hypothetical protein